MIDDVNRSNMIVLATDFGLHGPYTGQMRAAIMAKAPDVRVIDLFADLPAGNSRAAAYLLAAYTLHLPTACVLICVVDPGVGSARRALVLQLDGRWFVGPDNGLFEMVIRRCQASAEVHEITWRPAYLSESFHGRDILAPPRHLSRSAKTQKIIPIFAGSISRVLTRRLA